LRSCISSCSALGSPILWLIVLWTWFCQASTEEELTIDSCLGENCLHKEPSAWLLHTKLTMGKVLVGHSPSLRFVDCPRCLAGGFHCLLAPHRDSAPSRERKEKTAYKNRPGADTMAELCPLDPIVIGLELVSTSTPLYYIARHNK
jgi:hypothetical protein